MHWAIGSLTSVRFSDNKESVGFALFAGAALLGVAAVAGLYFIGDFDSSSSCFAAVAGRAVLGAAVVGLAGVVFGFASVGLGSAGYSLFSSGFILLTLETTLVIALIFDTGGFYSVIQHTNWLSK